MTGTRVTCTDIATGESETQIIENNYVVVCDGDRYLDGIQAYPKSGTVVLTIKRRSRCSDNTPVERVS